MVRIRAQLVDLIQRQKRYMYFGYVVCLLLDALFIVGTSLMVQEYIFAAFLSLTEKNQVWSTRKGFLPSVSILHTSAPSRRLNDKVKRSCTSHELVLT